MNKELNDLEKYSRRNFKSKRLRKKQAVKLLNAYNRLSGKYGCWVAHVNYTGPVGLKEQLILGIRMIFRTVELTNKHWGRSK